MNTPKILIRKTEKYDLKNIVKMIRVKLEIVSLF
jgi:hypothetical protein